MNTVFEFSVCQWWSGRHLKKKEKNPQNKKKDNFTKQWSRDVTGVKHGGGSFVPLLGHDYFQNVMHPNLQKKSWPSVVWPAVRIQQWAQIEPQCSVKRSENSL